MNEANASPVLAVDLGGTSARIAVGDPRSGELSVEKRRSTGSVVRPAEILDFLAEAVDGMEGSASASAVGMAFPGLLDDRGRVISAPNLDPSWQGLKVAAELERRVGREVVAMNDARTAALGELAFGHSLPGSELSRATAVYVGLGTGVGGGVVIGGRLHLGRSGSAGELGHVVVERDGRRCTCGGRGCVEAYAGGAALAEAGRRLAESGDAPALARRLDTGEELSVRTMVAAADEGDGAVRAELEVGKAALGVLVADLVHVLSPDLVVFGGGLSRMGDDLLESVWSEVRERVRMTPVGGLRIECSKLVDRAGLLGALLLPGVAAAETGAEP